MAYAAGKRSKPSPASRETNSAWRNSTALNSRTRNQGPIVGRIAAIDRVRHLKTRLKTSPRTCCYLKACPRCQEKARPGRVRSWSPLKVRPIFRKFGKVVRQRLSDQDLGIVWRRLKPRPHAPFIDEAWSDRVGHSGGFSLPAEEIAG